MFVYSTEEGASSTAALADAITITAAGTFRVGNRSCASQEQSQLGWELRLSKSSLR